MGTNYYATVNACPHCGRADEADNMHIGKSSAGWTFGLHVIPERGLVDWPEWRAFLAGPGVTIRDEYGEVLTLDELTRRVTERSRPGKTSVKFDFARNHAEPGPNGLVRRRIGRWCTGHGAGTWDLVPGDFS
jgi:hypothetical protein